MNQPIKIQLNAEALASLFPEGSDARVELQKAVIVEFTRRHLKEAALGPDVQATIERARTDALEAVNRARLEVANKAVKDLGVELSPYSHTRYELKKEAKDAVTEAARQAVRDQITSDVGALVTAAAEGLRDRVTEAATSAVQRIQDAEIRKAVKARIDEIMASFGKV